MESDDRRRHWAQDAALLAGIGREIFLQPSTVLVRLSKSLADPAVTAWERGDSEAPLAPETPEQTLTRHRAGALGLIGLSIQERGRPDGDGVVVEVNALQVGEALQAADDAGLLTDLASAQPSATPGEGEWYSVRCVFRAATNKPWGPSDLSLGESAYEERITLWRAGSGDEAIAMAETEAQEYASVIENEYVGIAQAYWLADELGHGAEVFSLIRRSELDAAPYLDAFFDTGTEYQRQVGESGQEPSRDL